MSVLQTEIHRHPHTLIFCQEFSDISVKEIKTMSRRSWTHMVICQDTQLLELSGSAISVHVKHSAVDGSDQWLQRFLIYHIDDLVCWLYTTATMSAGDWLPNYKAKAYQSSNACNRYTKNDTKLCAFSMLIMCIKGKGHCTTVSSLSSLFIKKQ